MVPVSKDDVAIEVERVRRAQASRSAIMHEVGKLVVGQTAVVEQLLVAMFAGGHGLLIGVPGLAKTTLVAAVAKCMALRFTRIQFTPDLMPSDVTGTEVLEEDRATGRRTFRFQQGPVFSNIVLADEINRTPPKTQAALLEAMQEQRVTIAGTTHVIELPFVVFATQNPIEQEGTYPLPEAQLDRFMLAIRLDYPEIEDEVEIVRSTSGIAVGSPDIVLGPADVLQIQSMVREVPAADYVIRTAVGLVRKTRPGEPGAPTEVRDFVAWGAGPRAAQHLVLAAKALALLRGEFAVTPDHIRELAVAALAHRVVVNFHAEAERVTAVDVLKILIGRT